MEKILQDSVEQHGLSGKQKNTQITNDKTNEFDISDIEDIEPYDNSKESYDYNFEREDKDKNTPELQVNSIQQQSAVIGFDFIKLKFPLIHSKEAKFSFNRHSFFRTSKPSIPARSDENIAIMYAEDKNYRKMLLTNDEKRKLKLSEYENEPYKRAKLIFPNSKPFYDLKNHLIGLGHMYIHDGDYIVSFTSKIISGNGDLSLLNIDTIDDALNVIKSTNLVKFDNEIFKNRALVLSAHITNDLLVPQINTCIKAFSSYLPMRTDRYCVLKYENSGYEILARGKQSKQVPNYHFCIYNKGLELREHNQQNYIRRIGTSGMSLANNILRLELRLQNFPAIRKFLAPTMKNGTLTLNELLACQQKPIIEMLSLLNITSEKLRESRGKYITMVEDKTTSTTQAEFERMHGLIRLLELNDYSLDKVRSYIETETGRKTHSTYFKEKRDILQRYITCYMPETVARLTEIVEAIKY